MTNHFALAEQLLAKAEDCVVDQIERKLVARAAVHAQLAQVQALEAAYELRPAVGTGYCEDSSLLAFGAAHIPAVETRLPTNDFL